MRNDEGKEVKRNWTRNCKYLFFMEHANDNNHDWTFIKPFTRERHAVISIHGN